MVARYRTVRTILIWISLSILILAAHRATFFLLFFADGNAQLGLSLYQWFRGIRFDLATTPLMVGPWLLVLPWLLFAERWLPIAARRLRKLLHGSLAAWLTIVQLLFLGSSYNYYYNSKHIAGELFAYANDASTILGGAMAEDGLAIVAVIFILILVGVGLYWLLERLWIRTQHSTTERPRRPLLALLQAAATTVAVVALLLISGRGGIQENPLRTADAISLRDASSPFLGNLPLNPLFTVAHDSQDRLEFRTFYPIEKNIPLVQRLLLEDQPDDPFVDPRYPLLRYMPPQPLPEGFDQPPNIVIILLESFTAKFLERHGGDPHIAPNLNRLIEQGLYFERGISSGGRSANGVVSIYSGLPDRAGRTLLRSAQIRNRFGGLGHLLGAKGYSSLFLHGEDLAFDNLNTGLPHFGIERMIGDDQLEKVDRYRKSSIWGFDDEYAYDAFERELADLPEPFFASVFTLNSHHPYIIPEGFPKLYDSEHPESDFLNSYHYADWALGRFMESAKEQEWYARTLFVLISDHSHHRFLDYLEDRHIPILFYAPGFIEPEARYEIAAQVDLTPTLLSWAGGDLLYASIGRDLRRSRTNRTFFAGGSGTNVIGWIEEDRIVYRWLQNPDHTLLLTAHHPASNENLNSEEPERAYEWTARASHIHQFVRSLELENLVWPAPDEVERLLREQRSR